MQINLKLNNLLRKYHKYDNIIVLFNKQIIVIVILRTIIKCLMSYHKYLISNPKMNRQIN